MPKSTPPERDARPERPVEREPHAEREPYTGRTVDEFALLRAWQRGDAQSGGELLARHTASVYHFFLTKTDPVAAEELTQSVFEACARRREDLQANGSIRAYLFAIARNKLLQHRDEWRRRGAQHDAFESGIAANLTSPSMAVARSQQQQLVITALQRLPLDLQIALELHYWEEMSVAEIAEVLAVAPGTVKSRMHRARELLRDAIVDVAGHGALATSSAQDLEAWLASLARARGQE